MAGNKSLYGVSVDALKSRLKTSPQGAYLFFGEEEYLKKFYLQKFRDLIENNGFEELNRTRFDFEGKTVSELCAELDRMPMMSPLRLVEVRGMQPLKLPEKEQKKLLEALDSLGEDVILIIYCLEEELTVDKKNAGKGFAPALAEKLMAVNFSHLTEHALIGWIHKVLGAVELSSTEQAARLLVRLCSRDMLRMRNELYKLEEYVKNQGRRELREEDVKLFVQPDSEAQVFQLADAVLTRDAALASQIYEGLKAQRVEPVIVAGYLAKTIGSAALAVSGAKTKEALSAAKMQEWQAAAYREKARIYDRSYFSRALELCLECDRKLKSQGQDGNVLVENLIFTLIKLGVEKSGFYK